MNKAKETIRKDKNNTQAYACLVVAYDLLGNDYLAIKTLRDIEENFAQELIDEVHDHLWNISPEILAKKEFKDRRTLSYGNCIIKNTSMIDGYGYLLIGEFITPSDKLIKRHLTSYKCNKDFSSCKHSDIVCPNCEIINPQLVIKVNGYKIEELVTITPSLIDKNLRYIKQILELQREIYVR
ncbi:MAG: hypothetical protein N2738_08320 [Thermodesulfovibrionales bacterium]|nr:hypothetical protein [Thermodesulfovibrionales bacterium]